MIVANKDQLLILTDIGDVVEPDDGVCAIGSGGMFVSKSFGGTDLPAREIALKAMEVASDLCVFTNKNFVLEEV